MQSNSERFYLLRIMYKHYKRLEYFYRCMDEAYRAKSKQRFAMQCLAIAVVVFCGVILYDAQFNPDRLDPYWILVDLVMATSAAIFVRNIYSIVFERSPKYHINEIYKLLAAYQPRERTQAYEEIFEAAKKGEVFSIKSLNLWLITEMTALNEKQS